MEEPHETDDTVHFFNSSLYELDPFILYSYAAAVVVSELGWDLSWADRSDPDASALLHAVVRVRLSRGIARDDAETREAFRAHARHEELLAEWDRKFIDGISRT